MELLEGEESYDKDCPRPLHVAVQRNCGEVVHMLLTYGEDINAFDARGQTALNLASKLGYQDMVDVLKQYDATVETRNPNEYTPLHESAFIGNLDVVEVLVTYGTEIDAKHLAASKGKEEVIKGIQFNNTTTLLSPCQQCCLSSNQYENLPALN